MRSRPGRVLKSHFELDLLHTCFGFGGTDVAGEGESRAESGEIVSD